MDFKLNAGSAVVAIVSVLMTSMSWVTVWSLYFRIEPAPIELVDSEWIHAAARNCDPDKPLMIERAGAFGKVRCISLAYKYRVLEDRQKRKSEKPQ